MVKPRIVLLIFVSGKVVLTGKGRIFWGLFWKSNTQNTWLCNVVLFGVLAHSAGDSIFFSTKPGMVWLDYSKGFSLFHCNVSGKDWNSFSVPMKAIRKFLHHVSNHACHDFFFCVVFDCSGAKSLFHRECSFHTTAHEKRFEGKTSVDYVTTKRLTYWHRLKQEAPLQFPTPKHQRNKNRCWKVASATWTL